MASQLSCCPATAAAGRLHCWFCAADRTRSLGFTAGAAKHLHVLDCQCTLYMLGVSLLAKLAGMMVVIGSKSRKHYMWCCRIATCCVAGTVSDFVCLVGSALKHVTSPQDG